MKDSLKDQQNWYNRAASKDKPYHAVSVKDLMADSSATANGTSGGVDVSGLISTMVEVRRAVEANGRMVSNNVTMNNTVSQPAMVDEIARKVVAMLQQTSKSRGRSNGANPKLVR
jgi:hypothetical protein